MVVKSRLEPPYISSGDAKNILYSVFLKYLPDYLPTMSPISIFMQAYLWFSRSSHFYLLKFIF